MKNENKRIRIETGMYKYRGYLIFDRKCIWTSTSIHIGKNWKELKENIDKYLLKD